MSRKIFVTYKYADRKVAALGSNQNTTARDFLNLLEEKLSQDHIYKGEQDGQSLANFKESTIEIFSMESPKRYSRLSEVTSSPRP